MPQPDRIYNVLLVEDKLRDRRDFRNKLGAASGEPQPRNIKWNLKELDDPDVARAYLGAPPPNARPDVLVCDLDFSGRQAGIKLIEYANGLKRPVPSLAFSQSTARVERSECLLSGALGFLNKLVFDEMSAEALEQLLLDILDLSHARNRFREYTDWRQVHDASLALAHDLEKAMERTSKVVEQIVSLDAHDLDGRSRAFGDYTVSHQYAFRMVNDFSEAKHLLGQNPENAEFSLPAMVEKIIDASREYWIKRYNLKSLHFEVRNGFKCHAYCDELRVRRALENVLDNAAKFSLKDAVIVVRLEAFQAGSGLSYWKVVVCDNGPGVPEDKLDVIATPLVRLSHTAGVPGWGFGLYSCGELLEPYSSGLGLGITNPSIRNLSDAGGLEVTLFVPQFPD